MFISNDCTFFHLWWKKNLVKHQKASRSYEMVIDCYTIQISYHNWNIWARFKIQCWQHLLSIIAKMQNIWDLIGQNSTHIFYIFNDYRANTGGMGNINKRSGKPKKHSNFKFYARNSVWILVNPWQFQIHIIF